MSSVSLGATLFSQVMKAAQVRYKTEKELADLAQQEEQIEVVVVAC